jgi:hypothetical protein
MNLEISPALYSCAQVTFFATTFYESDEGTPNSRPWGTSSTSFQPSLAPEAITRGSSYQFLSPLPLLARCLHHGHVF